MQNEYGGQLNRCSNMHAPKKDTTLHVISYIGEGGNQIMGDTADVRVQTVSEYKSLYEYFKSARRVT